MSEGAQEIKARQRFVWAAGNYSEVAKVLEPASFDVVSATGTGPGTRLLDVGAGTGNLSVAAARAGATVLASDLTPELMEIGRARTESEGLNVEWRTADAENLPFEDSSFDVVGSVFGAIFAPRADLALGEMMRVVKPGGLVALTAWDKDSYTGATLALSARFGPPAPEGVDTPGSWGDAAVAKARFEAHAAEVEVREGSVLWDFESPEAAWAFMEENVPPMVVAKMMMPPERFEEMKQAYGDVLERFNRGTGGRVTIDSDYLLVLARKASGT